AAEARKRQKIVEIKEIKMRPSIDDHDYDVKMRSIKRFFDDGDKVKVTLRFRGRELAHQELGWEVLQRVKVDTEPIAKVESEPRVEGRQMVMGLAPRCRLALGLDDEEGPCPHKAWPAPLRGGGVGLMTRAASRPAGHAVAALMLLAAGRPRPVAERRILS